MIFLKNNYEYCLFILFFSRPVTTTNYIPRFSENDYAANGWLKSDPDVIPLPQPNIDIETSPKQHDRSWTTNSTRIQTTYKSKKKIFFFY